MISQRKIDKMPGRGFILVITQDRATLYELHSNNIHFHHKKQLLMLPINDFTAKNRQNAWKGFYFGYEARSDNVIRNS